MSLQIWFADDVSARLDGLNLAGEQMTGDFQSGWQSALEAVRASFFGMPTVIVIPADIWTVKKPECRDMRFNIHPMAT